MKNNIANKIKLFEAKIQPITPFDVALVDSTQVKEKGVKFTSPPIAKPRHKKKRPAQTEQAEYVNIIQADGAKLGGYTSLSIPPSSYYPQTESIQASYGSSLQSFDLTLPEYTTQLAYESLQPFDLAQSEYANLLPLGRSDKERFYADPEGEWVTIRKRHSQESIVKGISLEATQSIQWDLAQSEYANLLPLGTSDTERFYADPEGQTVVVKKNKAKEQL